MEPFLEVCAAIKRTRPQAHPFSGSLRHWLTGWWRVRQKPA